MNRLRIFLTIIVSVYVVFITSCTSDNKENKTKSQIIKSPVNETIDSWPNNNKSKHFKVDSSKFEIWAWKTSWWIRLEQNADFESQINKMNGVIKMISKQTNLYELRSIRIMPINYELLSDIAKVPEIQNDLFKSKDENGIVNSMGIVTPFAYKSKHLNELTNLFQQFNLEPYDYYIDKCFAKEIEGDSVNYTMNCATIHFKLKEIKKE